MRSSLFAVLALATAIAPVTAQESDVARRSYTYFDRDLTIEVSADAPGTLHLVRGSSGRIEVSGRARRGFAGFGLGGYKGRQLRLTAVGADRAEYMVVVPERVQVHVQLPTRDYAELASPENTVTYTWESPEAETAEAAVEPTSLTPLPAGMAEAYRQDEAPVTLTLADVRAVRSLKLRFTGTAFSIASSRPLAVETGDSRSLAIRPSGDPIDLIVYLPFDHPGFTLRIGGDPAVTARKGVVEALCSPVIIRSPTPTSRWVDLNPRDGRLSCR